MPEKYKSSSMERRVSSYLKPRNYMMFIAEMNLKIHGKSEHGSSIIDKHFERKSLQEQKQLLDHYDYITKKGKQNKQA